MTHPHNCTVDTVSASVASHTILIAPDSNLPNIVTAKSLPNRSSFVPFLQIEAFRVICL